MILISSWLSVIPVTLVFYPLGFSGNILIGIYAIIIAFVPFFILPKYVAKALLLIRFKPEGFQFDWVKPYWGSKSRLSQFVRLDELISYKFESSYNFSTLKLRLKSGDKMMFHRWYNDVDDDFDKFISFFRQTIETYNRKKTATEIIEREKSIMENRYFLTAVSLLIGLMLIATMLLIIFKGVSNTKGIIAILIVISPFIWVLMRVKTGLKKKRIA